MKKFLILVVLLFFGMACFSQNISVKSFRLLSTDITASSLEGKRMDQNGEVAALIKVMTTETGFVFEGGALGIVDTQQRVGEIWVWVPRGSRKITILHQQLGGLREYLFPVTIEAERTYEMVLTTAKIETIVKQEVNQQYLAFQVTPANAILEVNDQYWELDADGMAMKFVNFGTYTYRIQAKDYHTEAGQVKVDDPLETKYVTVALKPNFGWIEVTGKGSIQGANVFIDNSYVGKVPCKSEALKSGKHSVRIAKEMYETYNETITVYDDQIVTLTPSLKSNFAEVTLKVDADAEIWVNDELKGVRQWTGPLSSGTYKIECKKKGYESTLTSEEITTKSNGKTITLSPPRPIYGSLNVETNPGLCKLFIDGVEVGNTPKSIPEILIGSHQIRIVKEGYSDYTENITITQGERKLVSAVMKKGQNINSNTKPKTPATPVKETPTPKPSEPNQKLTYRRSIGVRLQSGYNLGAEISYQTPVGMNRFEINAGWYNSDFASLTIIYHQWLGNIAGDFGWFIGPGVNFGYCINHGFGVAAVVEGGIEWAPSEWPLQFTLDVRPSWDFLKREGCAYNGFAIGGALGIRYKL